MSYVVTQMQNLAKFDQQLQYTTSPRISLLHVFGHTKRTDLVPLKMRAAAQMIGDHLVCRSSQCALFLRYQKCMYENCYSYYRVPHGFLKKVFRLYRNRYLGIPRYLRYYPHPNLAYLKVRQPCTISS